MVLPLFDNSNSDKYILLLIHYLRTTILISSFLAMMVTFNVFSIILTNASNWPKYFFHDRQVCQLLSHYAHRFVDPPLAFLYRFIFPSRFNNNSSLSDTGVILYRYCYIIFKYQNPFLIQLIKITF